MENSLVDLKPQLHIIEYMQASESDLILYLRNILFDTGNTYKWSRKDHRGK